MFVGVVNFGQIQKIRFVVVKKFWSCSKPALGHFDLVMYLASFYCVRLHTRKGLQKNKKKCICENKGKCFGVKIKNKWVEQFLDPFIYYNKRINKYLS